MTPQTPQEAFELAVQRHQAGQLGEAEILYRQVLSQVPLHVAALHMLGFIAHQSGNTPAAVELLRRAIALKPEAADIYSNLGLFLTHAGRLDEAIDACRQAVRLRPDVYEAHYQLGVALTERGMAGEAIATFQNALKLRPESADALNGLGNALIAAGRFEDAIATLNRALSLRPNDSQIYLGIGNALQGMERYEESKEAYRLAIAARPSSAAARNNLGIALSKTGKLDDAIAEFRLALAAFPRFAGALNNLANALKEAGELDAALACYRQSVEVTPSSNVAGNILYTLHFHPAYGPAQIRQHHAAWNERYAAPLGRDIRPHANDSSPARRLRVGYVSPDLRAHPVGRFMLPLLAHHDRRNHEGAFEIVCYSDVRKSDPITRRLQSHADIWRDTMGLTDAQLADVIRQDRIDILVDLTMHMENNRLLTFARKPAPVQVTYLAYCSTTGLQTIDYRLTDRHLDPPTENDDYYSEKSVHLRSYWCYEPAPEAPAVVPPPALSAGFITFGCLNNYSKVTTPTLQTWRRLLTAVPRSRLIVHAPEGSHRQKAQALFAGEGVDPDRLIFVGRLPQAQYFVQYQKIDIALDPFPYAGGTTSCDALWMGVPLVTLTGSTAVSRSGVSILSNLNLQDLIAHTPDQYIQIAAILAQDLPRLTTLRSTLRQRLLASPILDADAFARDVESAYRRMWTNRLDET